MKTETTNLEKTGCCLARAKTRGTEPTIRYGRPNGQRTVGSALPLMRDDQRQQDEQCNATVSMLRRVAMLWLTLRHADKSRSGRRPFTSPVG